MTENYQWVPLSDIGDLDTGDLVHMRGEPGRPSIVIESKDDHATAVKPVYISDPSSWEVRRPVPEEPVDEASKDGPLDRVDLQTFAKRILETRSYEHGISTIADACVAAATALDVLDAMLAREESSEA